MTPTILSKTGFLSLLISITLIQNCTSQSELNDKVKKRKKSCAALAVFLKSEEARTGVTNFNNNLTILKCYNNATSKGDAEITAAPW
ncbi:MAG TPA: hypothetical protein PK453_01080 [Leptospiraceae bacterium]|nr:hypothetical protein [Leptospiraceae bacterium]HMY67312.1 hypothetical protein [Leptospiraceae bacterium]HNF12234.1 hypothetical protein [Leptospiraceae bacterium]HNF23269.1 hypothetical protein [Leptospiraceae bacterium]HNH08971.1 hypothetical protein [Leptospiraceae bacterium]